MDAAVLGIKGYIRFLAALQDRLTIWKEKEKYRPSLPPHFIDQLREVRKINGIGNDELRLILRTLTRDTRKEVIRYRTSRWFSFLSTIQGAHKKQESSFWSHLSKIFRPKTLLFSKLTTKNKILSNEKDITSELHKYYSDLAKKPEIDPLDPHDKQILKEFEEIKQELSNSNVVEIQSTSITEINLFIKKMKGKKPSGLDRISDFIIKLLLPTYVEGLVNCFNAWLYQMRYPDFWKISKIVALNKLRADIPSSMGIRSISLLVTHSKIFEKILLNRLRNWAKGNKLILREQSGFRSNYLLQTRVLLIFQEVQNNLTANVPTLEGEGVYRKAFDLVWHSGLIVKLHKLNIPFSLLKTIRSWLSNRTAYIQYGQRSSSVFNVQVGLPQGSSLSLYIFVVYHSDITNCLGAHSGDLFADDLSVLTRAPITQSFSTMLSYLEKEGSKICNKIAEYSRWRKQPLNVNKTVGQIFYSQVKKSRVNIFMLGQRIAIVDSFKYLGFTWTSKLSLRPTVNKCIENIQKSLSKLKWLRCGKIVSAEVLRRCFFAYTFPHMA